MSLTERLTRGEIMAHEQNISCEDVANKTARLQILGYQVLGSTPTPGMPGFCTLRFLSPAPTPAIQGPLDPLQQMTAKAIINILETSEVLGKYGQVTVIEDDSGHLTFGRSQTTLSTGNLGSLIGKYCSAPGARFSSRLQVYLPKLKDKLTELDNDPRLHNLLRATADDPVMRKVQDEFFDKAYWQPALAKAAQMRICSALGIAVVYDSTVHGSWELIRDRTVQQYGEIGAAVSEQNWIAGYIKIRREWLANHERPDLRRTVYRMDEFQKLVQHDSWPLELPLLVRTREISLTSLLAAPPDCYDGPALGSRPLAVTTPFTRGADVRLVQLGLSDAGIPVMADGVYGKGSAAAVRQYQAANGLASSDVIDKGLIMRIAESS
jgi:chitosanase